MKKILLLSLSLITSSLFCMQLDVVNTPNKLKEKLGKHIAVNRKTHINPSSVFVPERLGSLDLYHSKKGFSIKQDDQKYTIKKYFTDPILRDINKKQLKSFLDGGYVSINKMNDGEYSLQAKGRINGGGPIGASIGAFIGKAVVYVAGHGAIAIAAACTGPAAPVTFLALEGWFAAPIEGASMAGAVAGGIILGVATGPV